MNILELAEKEVGTVLVHGREYFEIDDVDGWNRVATAIAKQAVEEFKAGLVPVAKVAHLYPVTRMPPTLDWDCDTLSLPVGTTLYALGETK